MEWGGGGGGLCCGGSVRVVAKRMFWWATGDNTRRTLAAAVFVSSFLVHLNCCFDFQFVFICKKDEELEDCNMPAFCRMKLIPKHENEQAGNTANSRNSNNNNR